MKNATLVITSIASEEHPILSKYAKEANARGFSFVLIGDRKSPENFNLKGCDYYSIERQESLGFSLLKGLPSNHYSRKNIGYLVAAKNNSEIIIETDDDNYPKDSFWNDRLVHQKARAISNGGWVNVYKYFTNIDVWPRGFLLDKIKDLCPEANDVQDIISPIQQGLADENPDVDAVYRLTRPLPILFDDNDPVALRENSVCPFNSQNTTWFKEAFPLLYLPSYCSFRMTDIWRSFVAQRIAWTCGWPVLFSGSTVIQERNDHNLIKDLEDEVPGYLHNKEIVETLMGIKLKEGVDNIFENLEVCYRELVRLNVIDIAELKLLNKWIRDISELG